MSNFTSAARTSLYDPVLVTDLKWHPGARRPSGANGALVGTLLGVQVNGMDVGRGTAFQFATVFGEVRTVYWSGTMSFGEPVFHDVDTDEMVLRNSQGDCMVRTVEGCSRQLDHCLRDGPRLRSGAFPFVLAPF